MSRHRFMHPERLDGVVPSPARVAEIPEAQGVPAEEGSRIDVARAAHRILKVRVNLNLNKIISLIRKMRL